MQVPISRQTVVITGASSRIGRETALAFARRGASLVLASRNDELLLELAEELTELGVRAHAVAADPANPAQVENVIHEALERFGTIDTWVNNAAVSEHATVEPKAVGEIASNETEDLTGVMHGVHAILPHMKEWGQGTIINVGPVRAVRAAEPGVKGFTDALRAELARGRSTIHVALVMSASYDPRVVSDAIVQAAEQPRHEVFIGREGEPFEAADSYLPHGGRVLASQKAGPSPGWRRLAVGLLVLGGVGAVGLARSARSRPAG